jgi:hypothetical protein
MNPSICPTCSELIQVPAWLSIIGYAVHCHAKYDEGRHTSGHGHTVEFSLEGYQTAELDRLDRML